MENNNNTNKIVSLANIISKNGINNALEFAQANDNLYKLLIDLDLSPDELWNKYGSIFNLQDDLENNGIPVNQNIRNLWDTSVLESKQAELETMVEGYRKSVVNECINLVKEFTK